MKKCLSLLLCSIILFSQLSVFSQAIDTESQLYLSQESVDDASVESFSSDVSEMIEKFDDLDSETGTDESYRLIVKSTDHEIDVLDSLDYVKGYNDLHILQFKDEETKNEALSYYESLDTVEYVQEDRILEAAEIETDNTVVYENSISYPTSVPSYKFGYNNAKNNMSTANDVVVAVVDSGVQYDHEFLNGRVEPTGFNSINEGGTCYDDRGHGTQVAGIIAANTKNNVTIKPYKVLNQWGKGSETQVSLGIYAAIEDDVDIINLSLSMQGQSTILAEACQAAYDAGIIVVVAAGNAGLDIGKDFYSPGSFDNVLSIVACNNSKRVADFSNYGSVCDFAAPGVDILSSYLDNSYKISSGTSVASPFICAAVSYVLAGSPDMTFDEVKTTLQNQSQFCYGNKNIAYVRPDAVSTISSTVATPTFNFSDATFIGSINLNISCSTANAQILYKVNETEPVFKEYKNTLSITETSTITAYGVCQSMNDSSTATVTLTKIDQNPEDFVVDETGALLRYLGSDTQLIIPAYINGVSIVSIGEGAFKDNKSITSVRLDSNITAVGANAFEGCTSLQTFVGDGVMSLGEFCFYNCTMLESVSMNAITEIAAYAFKNAGAQTTGMSFIAPQITTIGNESFYNSGLTALTLAKLTGIGDFAFANSVKLRGITATALKTMGVSAFENCVMLNDAKYSNVTDIPEKCFNGCSSLSTISLSTVTSIGANAFSGCSSMQSFNFAKVTSIGEKAFGGCSSVTQIYLPLMMFDTSDTQSSYDVFDGCSLVTNVNVKFMSVKNLGELFPDIVSFTAPNVGGVPDYAFQGCTKLSTISIPNVQSAGAYAFSDTAIKTANYSKLATIGDYCFANIDTLETVILPGLTGITADNYHMFSGSDNITQMTFENLSGVYSGFKLSGMTKLQKFSAASLTSIPGKMFKDCTNLSSVSLDDVRTVGSFAFENCGLTKLVLTKVNSLHENALANNPNFQHISLSTITEFDLNVFSGSEANITYLAVSKSYISNNIDNGELGFSRFPKLETLYYGVETVEKGAISNCTNLKKLYLQNAITLEDYSIDNCPSLIDFTGYSLVDINPLAFAGTKNIETLTVDKVTDSSQISNAFNLDTLVTLSAYAVQEIPASFMSGCTKLTTIKLNSVKIIPQSAFRGCTSLKSATFSGSTSTVEDNAFSGCSSLTSFSAHGSLKTVGQYAFAGTKLSSITTSTFVYVTAVGAYAFKDCTNLKSVEFRDAKTFGVNVFEGCTALTTATLTSATSLGGNLFKNCVKLATVNLPAATNLDSAGVFEGCTSLKTFSSESVENLSDDFFRDCTTLQSVTLTALKSIPYNCFNGCILLKTISMPAVTEIGDYAFKGCTSLLSVNIETLEKIGNHAFENCTSLSSVALGDNVSYIGDCAFKNCSALSTVGSFAQINFGEYVFEDCTKLSSALFDGLSVIPEGMFKNCVNLTEIVDTDSFVTKIGAHAFSGCENIQMDNFNWGIIEYLGEKAFENSTFSVRERAYDMKSLKKAENNAFDGINVSELKLETIEYLYDVPDDSAVAVGKTLKKINLDSPSNVLVCGHKGTISEEYCKTNNISFAAFGSGNAVSQPLCKDYYERSTTIDFSPIAFNPGYYQWYGCNSSDRCDAEKLTGMTTKKITPAIVLSATNDEGKYRYYFCEYQSVENGVAYTYQSALINNLYSYIQGTEDTVVSHDGQMIYTDSLKNIGEYTGIFTTPEKGCIEVEASYSCGDYKSYGTGSQVHLLNSAGEIVKTYYIVVYGDVNCDGVVDVLDSLAMAGVVNGHASFNDFDYLAADISSDGNIDVEDYQQVINKSVA